MSDSPATLPIPAGTPPALAVRGDEAARLCGVNITMPERILDAVDRYAHRRGETRSGLLARAAMEYIGRQSDAALASAGRRQLKSRKSKRRA